MPYVTIYCPRYAQFEKTGAEMDRADFRAARGRGEISTTCPRCGKDHGRRNQYLMRRPEEVLDQGPGWIQFGVGAVLTPFGVYVATLGPIGYLALTAGIVPLIVGLSGVLNRRRRARAETSLPITDDIAQI